MRLEEVLGPVKAESVPRAGVLCKSSRFDLVPRKASEEVDASSSPQSTAIALDDTVVLVTVEELGEMVDFRRGTSTVACCSTWLFLPTGEAWSVC